MLLPLYGRYIQDMIAMTAQLPSREQRQQTAAKIVRLMATRALSQRSKADTERMLWSHLWALSDGKLDIDWPFDPEEAMAIQTKPEPLPLPESRDDVKFRHHGRLMQQFCGEIAKMAPSRSRDDLTYYAGAQMKRNLQLFGHGSSSDERIADDMAAITDGALQLNLSQMGFSHIKAEPQPVPVKGKKKNKKFDRRQKGRY